MNDFKEFMLQKHGMKEQAVGEWDVVLFCGRYNPMTAKEYKRIIEFTDRVVRNPDYNEMFSDNVEYGLLVDLPDDEENISNPYGLTLEEREFITGRFFGLKMFPINYRKLMWLMLPIPDQAKQPIFNRQFIKKSRIEEKYGIALEKFKDWFDKTNILIVVDPDEPNALPQLDKITTHFKSDDVTIGFLVWSDSSDKMIKSLGTVPVAPEILKAIVLMDHDRPDPEDLKSFAYKYHLGDFLDEIRSIHFRVDGERYLDAFRLLFPEVILFDEDEENQRENDKVIMEMLKKMFLGDEYINFDENQDVSEFGNVDVENDEDLPLE